MKKQQIVNFTPRGISAVDYEKVQKIWDSAVAKRSQELPKQKQENGPRFDFRSNGVFVK